MQIEISNRTSLKTADLPGPTLNRIKARLTFDNPAYLDNERRGYSNWDTPQHICGYEQLQERLTIPRGFTRQLLQILRDAGIAYELDDRRRVLPDVDFTFTGQLRDYQQQAVEAMLSRDFGVLQAPTGSGKTIMALSLIAARRQPALIVVHTRELVEQWVARIEKFLIIPADQVGVIGGGEFRIGDNITVATVQSLYKCHDDIRHNFGYLIVDECHRTPGRTFSQAVTVFDCRYMTGLSATPWRRDRLSRLIYWALGDKVHEIERQQLEDNGSILKAEIVWRETDFEPTFDPSEEYSQMLSELSRDEARNALIVADVAQEAGRSDGVCLVLSDRKSHCKLLVDMLKRQGIDAAMLTGDLSHKARQAVIEAISGGSVKVICATGALVGEGFDASELSTLFMATPIKFSGRVIQYLGRILRPAPGKEARVFDYLDTEVGVLVQAARGRQRVYEG